MIINKQISNNVNFKGNFENTKELRERLSEDSLYNNRQVLFALDRMDEIQDNKTYRYVEYNKNFNWNGMRNYSRYGVIVDENDQILVQKPISTRIDSLVEKSVKPNFISEMICEFVDDRYPQDKKNVERKILDLLI